MNKIILFLVLSLTARAEVAPKWVTKPPADDSNYKYYVGRATGISEAEAVSLAVEDAKTQAIRDNFGITTKVQYQAYEAMEYQSLTKRVDEASFTVLIKSFQQVELYQKDREYWVLYRYSKKAIEDESKRLANVPQEKVPQYSVVEGKKQKGGVEIATEPSDVAVFIDGVQYGYSPTKIASRLEVGTHSIRYELPGYKTVEEDLIIGPGIIVKINKILTPEQNTVETNDEPVEPLNYREKQEQRIQEQFYSTENPRPDLS